MLTARQPDELSVSSNSPTALTAHRHLEGAVVSHSTGPYCFIQHLMHIFPAFYSAHERHAVCRLLHQDYFHGARWDQWEAILHWLAG